MEALIVASGQHTPVQTGSFALVFPTNASEAEVQVEVKQLATLHPDSVHPPLYQNPDTGMLVPPTASNGVALYPGY